MNEEAEGGHPKTASYLKKKYPNLYQKAMRAYGDDSLYAACFNADDVTSLNKAMKILESVRGPAALENIRRVTIEGLKNASELRSRRAMYWANVERIYRLTKRELVDGSVLCPRCRKEMILEPYTKTDRMYCCSGCRFKIPRSNVIIASLTSRRKTFRASVIKPLYGHTNEATAYVVDDYPYGFRLRTQIRYWLEYSASKGWRFVSQTLNPKNQRWSAPKKSTYDEWAGAMYLDEQGHVRWRGLHRFSPAEEFLSFVNDFPQADLSIVKKVAAAKIKTISQIISGEMPFKINNVPRTLSEDEKKDYLKEIEIWEKVLQRS